MKNLKRLLINILFKIYTFCTLTCIFMKNSKKLSIALILFYLTSFDGYSQIFFEKTEPSEFQKINKSFYIGVYGGYLKSGNRFDDPFTTSDTSIINFSTAEGNNFIIGISAIKLLNNYNYLVSNLSIRNLNASTDKSKFFPSIFAQRFNEENNSAKNSYLELSLKSISFDLLYCSDVSEELKLSLGIGPHFEYFFGDQLNVVKYISDSNTFNKLSQNERLPGWNYNNEEMRVSYNGKIKGRRNFLAGMVFSLNYDIFIDNLLLRPFFIFDAGLTRLDDKNWRIFTLQTGISLYYNFDKKN